MNMIFIYIMDLEVVLDVLDCIGRPLIDALNLFRRIKCEETEDIFMKGF